MRARRRGWTLALALGALGLLLSAAGLRSFVVRSGSMAPTLLPGDLVLGEVYSLGAGPPPRGAVVAWAGPERWWIKRVVGRPRDALALRDSVLYRNGRAVAEPWAHYAQGGLRDLPARVLGAGEVLVLGDARDASLDSRHFGPLRHQQLGARLRLRIWPPARWGWLR